MIDAVEFKKVVESYYNDFTQRYWDEEEGFKWKAVKAFSEKWDIDSSDFSAMLKAALYLMSGNKITVRTLDLYQSFAEIRKELDGIVAEHF